MKTFASRVAAALTLVFLLAGDRAGGDDAVGRGGATVVISEFMASNVAGLRDRYGERSDWIELHNAGAEAVDLGGWHLTDDARRATRWTFPPRRVEPGAYLLVFASGRGTEKGEQELHADFKLAAHGGYLALARPDGAVAQAITYPRQRADVSYGVPLEAEGATARPGYLAKATPGAANDCPAVEPGPRVEFIESREVRRPAASDPIDVAVRVTAEGRPVGRVTVHYRVMFGATMDVDMADDGGHADGAAGDGVYGARIPANVARPGEMVRWFVTAADTAGHVARAPAHAADDSPKYFGTVLAESPATAGALPVFAWLAEQPARAATEEGTRASIYFRGRFYDNVRVDRRGAATTRGYRFHFNPKDHLRLDDGPARYAAINVNYRSGYDDTQLRPTLAFEAYRDAGAFYSLTFPVRLERNGAPQAVAYLNESPAADYLRRQGLSPGGPLYKITVLHGAMTEVGRYTKKARQWEDNADLQGFLEGIHRPGPAGQRYILDHLDLSSFLTYMAVTTVINDNDHIQKNYFLYKDTAGDGRWRVFPWDKDLTFGKHWTARNYEAHDPQTHPFVGDRNHRDTANGYNWLIDRVLNLPGGRQAYLRRLRSVMDALLQPPSTPMAERQFEARLDQLRAAVAADPRFAALLPNLDADVDALKRSYLDARRRHLYVDHGTNVSYPDFAGIPAAQPAKPALSVVRGGVLSVRVENPNDFAVDLSGWTIDGPLGWRLRSGSVVAGHSSAYFTADVRKFLDRADASGGDRMAFLYAVDLRKAPAVAGGGGLRLSDSKGIEVATDAGKP